MIKEFCLAWEKNKDILKEYFRTHKQNEYNSYVMLTRLLFDLVINPEMDFKFDTDEIAIIDDGDYQGTLVFILHICVCQPAITNYVYTSVCYGSCCGCDTLQSIYWYNCDALPTDEQIDSYMLLCLHLLQKCVYMIGLE